MVSVCEREREGGESNNTIQKRIEHWENEHVAVLRERDDIAKRERDCD